MPPPPPYPSVPEDGPIGEPNVGVGALPYVVEPNVGLFGSSIGGLNRGSSYSLTAIGVLPFYKKRDRRVRDRARQIDARRIGRPRHRERHELAAGGIERQHGHEQVRRIG